MEHHSKFFLIFCLIISISRLSVGREIRPTEHGLGFQNSAVEDKDSPEMRSFFGTKTAAATATVPVYPIPTRGGDSLERSGNLMKAVLVVTFLCGAAGAGVLIGAGLIFFFRRRWAGPLSSEEQNKDEIGSSGPFRAVVSFDE